MTTPTIISFFTKDTIYEKEVQELIESCKNLHLDYIIEGIEDLGSWQKNCCQKPLFIQKCLQKTKRPLLWVDADGIILKTPFLPLTDGDVSFYFNHWEERRARAGTIFALPSLEAIHFFGLWHRKCQEMQDYPSGDQHFLPEALAEATSLRVGQLPLSYVHVFDRDQIPISDTYILHTQASRTALMLPLFWKSLSGKDLKRLRIDNACKK